MKGGGGLLTDNPVKFEKSPVEIQEFGKITGCSRRIFWNILSFDKGAPKDVNV